MPTIHDIIVDYQEDEISLESMEYYITVALEANVTEEIDDERKKEANSRTFLDRLQSIITRIIAILNKFASKMSIVLSHAMKTDDGFRKDINTAIRDRQPYNQVRLVSFDYDDAFLDTQVKKMDDIVSKIVTSLRTSLRQEKDSDQHPLSMSPKDLNRYILKLLGAPPDVTDMSVYFLYVKKRYRRKKKETIFSGSNTRLYYQEALGAKKLHSIIISKSQIMKSQVEQLRNELKTIARSGGTADHMKRNALKKASNAAHLYNTYANFLRIYSQLRIEKMLTYRAVLTKLFNI